MIDRAEVLEFAEAWSLSPAVVEKDYVLGWVLAGIHDQTELARNLVFKGGTCLKKCYFETYRFSEDLDFTLRYEQLLNEADLLNKLWSVCEWVYDRTGIEIPSDQTRVEVYQNSRGGNSAEGRLYYTGPLRRRRGGLQKIKLDLTADELLVVEPVLRSIAHPYSDVPEEGLLVGCYAYEEVFAEKIRALCERCRPRDLYDVVQLFRREESSGIAGEVRDILERKCRFKGIAIPLVDQFDAFRPELESEWKSMLGHQLPVLPPLEAFWKELEALFLWLDGQEPRQVYQPIPIGQGAPLGAGDSVLPARARRSRAILQLVRFSAANRLCVDLEYQSSTRRIEPYALRKSKAGDILLIAVRVGDGEIRSYRIDRITGVTPTNQPFEPRYPIELTTDGRPRIPLLKEEPLS